MNTKSIDWENVFLWVWFLMKGLCLIFLIIFGLLLILSLGQTKKNHF